MILCVNSKTLKLKAESQTLKLISQLTISFIGAEMLTISLRVLLLKKNQFDFDIILWSHADDNSGTGADNDPLLQWTQVLLVRLDAPIDICG